MRSRPASLRQKFRRMMIIQALRASPMSLAISRSSASCLACRYGPIGPSPALDGSCAHGVGPKLYVNVTGLKDRGGRLKLELYPGNEADFLKDDRTIKAEGKQMRRVWSQMPASGPVVLCIRAPSAGQWATTPCPPGNDPPPNAKPVPTDAVATGAPSLNFLEHLRDAFGWSPEESIDRSWSASRRTPRGSPVGAGSILDARRQFPRAEKGARHW